MLQKKPVKFMQTSSEPKISIIMANYNGMPYLKLAVQSILSQTYKNFEFIIVDDASDDSSWGYLKKLGDKRIKLIKNNKNLGLAVSLNKALKIAKGVYIARMDADDISHKRRIDTQLMFMQSNSSVDLCGTWVKIINENNLSTGKIHHPTEDDQIKKTLRRITPLIHPTWFSKKKVLLNLKGYDPRWDMVEDYELLLRARNYKMANVPKELLLWRSSKSRRSNKYIQAMYTKNFLLKLKYFKEGKLDLSYFPYLLRGLVSTYFFPTRLKIYLNKKAGLI